MSNPRPCAICGGSKENHRPESLYLGIERTEPLRAKRDDPTLGIFYGVDWGTAIIVPEPTVPVRVLREFLDAERAKAQSLRDDCDDKHLRFFYGGTSQGLYNVYVRFCGED